MVTVSRLNSAARRVYVAAQSIPGIKNIFIQGEKKNAALNSILGFNSKVDRLQYLAEHSEGTLKASVEAELKRMPVLLDEKSRDFLLTDLDGSVHEGKTAFKLDAAGKPGSLSSLATEQLTRPAGIDTKPKS